MKLFLILAFTFITSFAYSQQLFNNASYKTEEGNIYVRNDSVVADFGYIKFEIDNWSDKNNLINKIRTEVFSSIYGPTLEIIEKDGYYENITIHYYGQMFELLMIKKIN